MKKTPKRIPRVSAKRLAADPSLGRRSSTIAPSRKPLKKSYKAIRQSNSVAKAKRTKKYKAYLSSAAWKAKRQARFKFDNYRCTARIPAPAEFGPCFDDATVRCPYEDWTGLGRGLVCDHLTYARFGNENMDDLRTLCDPCNRRETVLHRANWSR